MLQRPKTKESEERVLTFQIVSLPRIIVVCEMTPYPRLVPAWTERPSEQILLLPSIIALTSTLYQ